MRIISIILACCMLLFLVSCNFLDSEILLEYNEKTYTSDCKYGPVESFWSLNTDELTSIKVDEFDAYKVSGDENEIFVALSEALYVRKDYELPDVDKNKDEITQVSFDFLTEVYDISTKEETRKYTDIILQATNKTTQTNDNGLEFLANVNVRFREFSADLFVGKLLIDTEGKVFFSSCLNPNSYYRIGQKAKSWYVVSIDKFIEEDEGLRKIINEQNKIINGFE